MEIITGINHKEFTHKLSHLEPLQNENASEVSAKLPQWQEGERCGVSYMYHSLQYCTGLLASVVDK